MADLTDDLTSDQRANEKPRNRVTVAEAARVLGLSAEAVRMRIKRGTLVSEKSEGTVYVLLNAAQTRPNEDQTSEPTANRTGGLTADQADLVETLRSEVEFLREELQRREEVHVEENRRKDTIIAQLTQRIPELPPASPQEVPGGTSEGSEASGKGSGKGCQHLLKLRSPHSGARGCIGSSSGRDEADCSRDVEIVTGYGSHRKRRRRSAEML